MKNTSGTLIKCMGLISVSCFLAFTALVLVLDVLHAQENPFSHTISEYAVEPGGFLMTGAFLLRALGAACLVTGLAVGTARSRRSWMGLAWLALFAVCSFLVAIFPASREAAASIQFRIHSMSALIGFSSLVIAALAWALKGERGQKSALVSFVPGLFMLLSLLGFLVSPPGWAGLTERVLEVIMILWLCFISWRLSTLAFVEPSRSPA